ncbi:hypothetical protein [Streptomyces sp. NBC_01264]|uniref:hypothetical protein n=1 Tax=Streptomyces sp. NBC_01264 TaxID=2903804 RepID=UPI00225B0755|nr:hypothetical protein [Streptomyces sp. NBC_01264]MCX4784640.1 hypothetical protein [Streptomyces sp. NBC_01264]
MLSADRLRAQLESAQRHIVTARARAGRVATAAGATAATTGLFTPAVTGESLLAAVIATGAGLALLPTGRSEGHQKKTVTVLYLSPGVSFAGVMLAERIVPGTHWGEALAVVAWTAGVWLLRPARAARHMLVPPLPAPAEPLAGDPADTNPAARFWSERVAIEGGAAPGTVLDDVERTGPESLRAVIRSAAPGLPVPDISIRHLSALMDVPETLIKIGPVPGRGASVRLLTVGDVQETDPMSLWAQQIAPLAMPGSVITHVHHEPVKETQ